MTYQTFNPYNEQLLQHFTEHDDDYVESALATANSLFHSYWSTGNIQPRLEILHRLADLFVENREKLAQTIAIEMGKPIKQGLGEIDLCTDIIRYYAENAAQYLKPQKISTNIGESWIEWCPIGVLLAIEPWNFPFYQLVRVVAPAIALGNPVLFKHASIVPQCAALFEHLIKQTGAPQGTVTNLYISIDKVSQLIADDRIQGIALTGSESAGSQVGSIAAKSLKKSTLELGGSDAFIVLDDADIAQAIQLGVNARLANAGQVCAGAKRFILQHSIADEFIAGFVQGMQNAMMGDPLQEETVLGPLSSPEALEHLSQQVQTAVQHGAKILTGGQRAQRTGLFFEPTVLSNITKENPIYYQEFFGPVAQIFIVESDEEAAHLANDSFFGLGCSIFSNDIQRANQLATQIESGMVYINTTTKSRPELPFGGIKHSGFGRELGEIGLKEFSNQKLIVINKSDSSH